MLHELGKASLLRWALLASNSEGKLPALCLYITLTELIWRNTVSTHTVSYIFNGLSKALSHSFSP